MDIFFMIEKIKQQKPATNMNSKAEFDFHQKRFENMSDEYNKRGIIQKIIDWQKGRGWTEEMSPIDFAHEEAIRDNIEFEKRKSLEFKAWEKNLAPVIERLLEKRDLSSQEGEKIKTLLLVLGGGMKGSYSAGQMIGLNKMGLGNVFDSVVGISAGAGMSAYFSAGEEQTLTGASLFYEECSKKEFIDFERIHRIMDVDVVANAMRSGKKSLDQEAILNSPRDFFVVVTNINTLQPELINVKTAVPDMISAVNASMAIPLVYRKEIELNGGQYIDGGLDPLPIEKIIEKFHPTDILILPNMPFERMDSFETNFGEFLVSDLMQGVSKVIPGESFEKTTEKIFQMNQKMRKSLEFIQGQQKVNIGVLWPQESGLGTFTVNSETVKTAMLESARDTIKAFKGEQPKEIGLFSENNKS